MSRGSVSDETLTAYADGELDADEAARVREAVAADPALARRLAAVREAREAARLAYADVAREPVPAALIASVLAAAAAAPPPRRGANTNVRRAAAIAAAVALVVGGMLGALLAPSPTRMAHPLDPLGPATPMLVRALDAAASGQEVAFMGGMIRLLATYPTERGPCRSFAVESATPVTALACREGGVWRTRIAVARPITADGFAPASGEDPLLRDLLDRIGAGGALDIEAERRAIARGWR
jgi:hypothetical protein